jgi:hypothetical protein
LKLHLVQMMTFMMMVAVMLFVNVFKREVR